MGKIVPTLTLLGHHVIWLVFRRSILRSVISIIPGLHGRPYVHSTSKLIKFGEGVSMS